MKKLLAILIVIASSTAYADNLALNTRCDYTNGNNFAGRLGNNITLKECIDEVMKELKNGEADGYFEYTYYTQLPKVYNASMEIEADAHGFTIKSKLVNTSVSESNLKLEYSEF
jgi:hypothetical protein